MGRPEPDEGKTDVMGGRSRPTDVMGAPDRRK
jgi:hypothetical protein